MTESHRDESLAVSVVIPCFNYGAYVMEAIDSCLSSTYTDIEIIVVNDGSTDPMTQKILRSLNRPKTIVIHTTKQGVSAARNTGILRAKGKYILTLDADDKIDRTLIKRFVDVLEAKPEIGYVYCWTQRFGDRASIWRTEPFDAYNLLFRNLNSGTALFRKEAWKAAGGFNEEMKTGYEDWDFWISLVEKGWLGHRIPEPLFYFRKHRGALLSKARNLHDSLVQQIRSNHPQMYEPSRMEALKLLRRRNEASPSDGYDDANPLVSIIIPCYNYGKYVISAIESCLSSTYRPIEIIVVNDGSTDAFTLDVLKHLRKPKTRIIHQENKGASAARNRGISEAKGTYILPLDADDRIEPDYIEEAVKVLETEPKVGFVTSWYKCFGEAERERMLPPFNKNDLLFNNIVANCSLFRKEAWRQAGGYNEQMKGYEDWDFWIALVECGWEGWTLPRFHFHYRKHKSSKFHRSRKNHSQLVQQIRENHSMLFQMAEGSLIADQDMLTSEQVLVLIKEALDKNEPFSLVRVGDGENVILAQDTVKPLKEVLEMRWAKQANWGQKGIKLPNLAFRDRMAAAINQADIVGIPYWENDPIIAPQTIKRPLTEAVFKHLNINPKRICHTFVNRTYRNDTNFWETVRGKRILLISRWGEAVKPILEEKPYEATIASIYNFSSVEQIDDVLAFIHARKNEFDIALVSCGVNAVVLCPAIAESTGKVALDFGKSLMFLVRERNQQ